MINPLQKQSPLTRQREDLKTNQINYRHQNTRSALAGKPRLTFDQAMLAVAGSVVAMPVPTGNLPPAPAICWALPCKVVA